MNTVKRMMKRVVVMKMRTVTSSIWESLSITTSEKPTAPRRPPYAMMNCSFLPILRRRRKLASQQSRYTPVRSDIKVRRGTRNVNET